MFCNIFWYFQYFNNIYGFLSDFKETQSPVQITETTFSCKVYGKKGNTYEWRDCEKKNGDFTGRFLNQKEWVIWMSNMNESISSLKSKNLCCRRYTWYSWNWWTLSRFWVSTNSKQRNTAPPCDNSSSTVHTPAVTTNATTNHITSYSATNYWTSWRHAYFRSDWSLWTNQISDNSKHIIFQRCPSLLNRFNIILENICIVLWFRAPQPEGPQALDCLAVLDF